MLNLNWFQQMCYMFKHSVICIYLKWKKKNIFLELWIYKPQLKITFTNGLANNILQDIEKTIFLGIFYLLFFWEACSGILLALGSGGHFLCCSGDQIYVESGIKPVVAICKASVLSPMLFLQLLLEIFKKCIVICLLGNWLRQVFLDFFHLHTLCVL